MYLPGCQETTLYDWCRLKYLSPDCQSHCLASLIHWPQKQYSILAWREDDFRLERKIFIPSLLSPTKALELARGAFPEIIPSPIVFRLDAEEPWLYE